ncbi:MAG TPA: hypothetical protein VMN39_10345, partial [Longimicrobiaceae bacterium]|nr:hypothetical protein [Longimicrobiaceae bacterium]
RLPPHPPMRRSAATTLLLLATAGHLAAQDGPAVDRVAVLGTPAATGDGVAEPSLRAVAPLGWSGALRIVLASPGSVLDVGALAALGDGWTKGHRWTPLHEQLDAPSVLGEPVPDAAAFLTGGIVTPDRPGTWQLESVEGDVLKVVTQIPAAEQRGASLNGYRIGIYPTSGSDRTDAYAPPRAFIEVTPGTTAVRISEHLYLGQFLTKDQFDVWPKYLALDLRLIDKLELVVQELNTMGVRAVRLHIMSGFRTPQYNGPGGDGRASLSRHMWGDAADVWVDNDFDGMMDDLNGDFRIDLDDAAVMMRAVERVERKYPELVGGAGTYPTAPTHGPYIHIDARGERARW